MDDTETRTVQVVGTVSPGQTVEAPLSGALCVLYQVELTALQRLLDGWERGGSRETAGSHFWVNCPLGQVLVDPTAADLSLGPVLRRRVHLGRDPALDTRLNALYERLARPLNRRTVACRERLLCAGQQVVLWGELSHQPDPRGEYDGYREPPRVPVLAAEGVELL